MNQAKIALLAVVAATAWAPMGCGGAGKVSTKSVDGQALPVRFEHEPCDLESSQVERVDVRADGKPGMIRVRGSGRENCRMVDFNHDGIPDTYVYLDDQGRIRRRESDFDRDGKTDEVDTYVNGVLVRKDRTTMSDGRFHTWDFYEGGKLHHRLRDSDGDGKVDQWWTWPDSSKSDCAVVRSDLNGDGQPEDVVDQCAGTTSAPASAASPSSDAGVTTAKAPSPPPATTTPDQADAGAGRAAASRGAR